MTNISAKYRKLLVIYGPTSVGKTSLALSLAKSFPGDIISADSRQIYRGMNIGTGKDLDKKSKFKIQKSKLWKQKDGRTIGFYRVEGTKIWLLDIIKPNQRFSSYDWAGLATIIIRDRWAKGILPIVVGGSAFYIKTLLDGLDRGERSLNAEAREILESLSLGELQEKLKKMRPEKWQLMNDSDRKNKRRLVRAIEMSHSKSIKKIKFLPKADTLCIYLYCQMDYLKQRIGERVGKRVRQGILGEIENLLRRHHWDDPGLNTLGYKEFRSYFEEKADLDPLIERWRRNEVNYAKRQLLWFKSDERFKKYDVLSRGFKSKINKLITAWYSKK